MNHASAVYNGIAMKSPVGSDKHTNFWRVIHAAWIVLALAAFGGLALLRDARTLLALPRGGAIALRLGQQRQQVMRAMRVAVAVQRLAGRRLLTSALRCTLRG